MQKRSASSHKNKAVGNREEVRKFSPTQASVQDRSNDFFKNVTGFVNSFAKFSEAPAVSVEGLL